MRLSSAPLAGDDLDFIQRHLNLLPPAEQEEVLKLLDQYEQRTQASSAHDDLLAFAQLMQPDYKIGAHHRHLADLLMASERGEQPRLSVSIAPRHGKTQLGTIYYAAWFMGRNPSKKLMIVSHTQDLAVDFGRKIRNIMASAEYQAIFPNVRLSTDSKSAGRWNTNYGGEFYAAGVGSSIAGRGADLLLVDDPHSEQSVLAGDFEAFEKAYEWFTFGARTRLMPQGRVVVIATRWAKHDLIGRLITDMTTKSEADQYHVVEFPAILNENTPDEKALWPEFFDLKALKATKASMPLFQWNAQYQQNPTAEQGAIIRREDWRRWDKPEPPRCEFVMMALDAAAEAHNRADFTACITFGVFYNEAEEAHQLIMLNAWQQRVEFPELKKIVLKEYKETKPDTFIVEKKSSGTPLYQELRRIGIMVQDYTPVRGTQANPNTKMARLNSVADIVRSGVVWAPMALWADEVIEQVASFPFGAHDDLCFSAGTQVRMADGTGRAIEQVLPGDFVDTPIGPRRVLAAGQTGVSVVGTLRAGAAVVTCTAGHPIATTEGWVRACDVNPSDVIIIASTERATSWGSKLRECVSRWWSSTGAGTGAIQTPHGRSIAGTSAEVAVCSTAMFGRSIMGPFRQDATSTTRTRTRGTTELRTWSVSLAGSIFGSMRWPRAPGPSLWKPRSILPGFVRWLQNGIAHQKGLLGIDNILRTRSGSGRIATGGSGASLCTAPVHSAGNPSRAEIPSSGIAVGSVSALHIEPRSVQKYSAPLERALSVGAHSTRYRPSRSTARRSVSSVWRRETSAPVPVYNLTVDEAHCFYANGVLTHNCDCVTMLLMRFRQGNFVRLPDDDIDDSLPEKTRRRRGYY